MWVKGRRLPGWAPPQVCSGVPWNCDWTSISAIQVLYNCVHDLWALIIEMEIYGYGKEYNNSPIQMRCESEFPFRMQIGHQK